LLHVLAKPLVALQVRIDRGLHRLLRQGSHSKKLVFQFGELELKMNARQRRISLILHFA